MEITRGQVDVVVRYLMLSENEGILDEDGELLMEEIVKAFPGEFEGAERHLNEVTPFWFPPGSKQREPNEQEYTHIQQIHMRQDSQKS